MEPRAVGAVRDLIVILQITNEVFGRNVERLKSLLSQVVPSMPTDDDCPCRRSLDGQRMPFDLP